MIDSRTIHAPPAERKAASRLTFIDWCRGLAAAIMLQGHVFHSFARQDLRNDGPYVISQFVGGIAPAMFLFLTGVTLSFLMHGLERKGFDRWTRVTKSFRRSGYLFLLAFLFRIQLWAFGLPYSNLTDIFKVDILNCMGLAIACVAPLAALTTAERTHAGIVVGLAIACASPLMTLADTSSWPVIIQHYLVPDYNYFTFFPWASFVAFGVSGGSIIRLVKDEHVNREMQWAAILGFGLIISGQHFSNLPYSLYPATEFWLNSPGLIIIKLGVILVLLALAFLWTHSGAGQGWSWIRQLGTTSLVVYWVHIELVYGRWFGGWKESLTLAQCAWAALVLTVLMIGLSVFWSNRKKYFPHRGLPVLQRAPQPVSGD